MRHLPWLAATLVLPLFTLPLQAQQRLPHDPLTRDQAHQIAQASIDPTLRVKLYTKFLDEHADQLKALAKRADTPARNYVISGKLEDFADLMDELASNLDVYDDRKADIRKALKKLNEAIPNWQKILHNLQGAPGFRIARTDAIDSSNDLSDQAKQLYKQQEAYFKAHKDQVGQTWHMPQAQQ